MAAPNLAASRGSRSPESPGEPVIEFEALTHGETQVAIAFMARLLEYFGLGRVTQDRPGHGPWASVDCWVLDSRLVMNGVPVDHRQALGHPRGVGIKIAGIVKPGVPIQIG